MEFESGVELYVLEGSGTERGRFLPLNDRKVELGRADDSRNRAGWLLLYEPTISSHQLTLAWDESRQTYKITNRSKTNATMLNGQVVEQAYLSHGDQLQIGRLQLHVIKKTLRVSTIRMAIRIGAGSLSPEDLCTGFYQLSVMLHAGIPLVRGMETLGLQASSAGMRKTCTGMAQALMAGSSLSSAMAAHDTAFSTSDIAIVKAAENSGRLPDALQRLADLKQKQFTMIRRVRGQLTYPIFVLVTSLVVILALGHYVFEQLIPAMLQTGAPIPPLTAALINISHVVSNPLIDVFAVAVLAFAGWRLMQYVRTPVGEAQRDTLMLKLPVIGRLTTRLCAARFCQTLAELYNVGVPILTGIEQAAAGCGNVRMVEEIRGCRKLVEDGASVGMAFRMMEIFPEMMLGMVEVGEESGDLGRVLQRAARFMEEDVDAVLEACVQMLEPLSIALIGVLVGAIVLAGFAPIYSLVTHL